MAMKNILYTLANQSSKKTKKYCFDFLFFFVGISLYFLNFCFFNKTLAFFFRMRKFYFVNKKQQRKWINLRWENSMNCLKQKKINWERYFCYHHQLRHWFNCLRNKKELFFVNELFRSIFWGWIMYWKHLQKEKKYIFLGSLRFEGIRMRVGKCQLIIRTFGDNLLNLHWTNLFGNLLCLLCSY